MTHTDAERGTTWYPKLLAVVIFMTETSLVAPQCSWHRTSQFGAADGCETSHHVQSERNLQEEATRLWDTYGINMELYCISPSTLAALLLYDHTLNHLLPSKQLPPEQPPLLFKIHSAHILCNTFERQEASFQQISKKFLYCDTTYQNKPTEEKTECPQSSAAGDRDTQAWTTTWLLPNPAMMGLLAACATSARQPLNRAAASGALQRSRHMAGHSVL